MVAEIALITSANYWNLFIFLFCLMQVLEPWKWMKLYFSARTTIKHQRRQKVSQGFFHLPEIRGKTPRGKPSSSTLVGRSRYQRVFDAGQGCQSTRADQRVRTTAWATNPWATNPCQPRHATKAYISPRHELNR